MKPVTCIVIVMVAALVVTFAPSGEAVTCSQVFNYIKPCVPYVTGSGPLGNCCGGVKGLSSAAKTPADKQAVCGCLKSLAGSYSGVNGGKAAGLPGQCGVSLPYKISPSTDCSKVQ